MKKDTSYFFFFFCISYFIPCLTVLGLIQKFVEQNYFRMLSTAVLTVTLRLTLHAW